MKTLSSTFKYTLLAMVIIASFALVVSYSDAVFAQGLTIPETAESCPDQALSCNPIIQWIQFFVNVLTVVIVAGSAVMIAIAGLQYMSARDNAQGVQAAKQKITNVFIGLISYFFLYGFMQWLIPGGVF